MQIGRGIGKKLLIGEIENKEIFSFSKKLLINYKDEDIIEIKSILTHVIEKYAKIKEKNTNPGFVILQKQPSFKIYEKAVKEIIFINDIKTKLKSLQAEYKGYKNERGIIGATASIAWCPKGDSTYELITYRKEKKWGTKRFVDNTSVKKIDKTCPSTFDNYDYVNKHNRLVPSSPCPVLYGIRGEDTKELMHAKSLIESENIDCWLIFETNQGTDDHLQKKKIKNIQPYQSVITEGTISKNPYTLKGGHVIFTIKDSTGNIDCAAYEPTKEFRKIIRELRSDDVIEVYGGVRKKPLTINIEKINIKHLSEHIEKVENPICTKCGKHMKSKGKNQEYKCKICGTKSDKPLLIKKQRGLHLGFYEVPVCARRHLSKPLKRILQF